MARLGPILVPLGSLLASLLDPLERPNRTKFGPRGPKIGPRRAKMASRLAKITIFIQNRSRFSRAKRYPSRPSWSRFGPIWGHLDRAWGHLGAILGRLGEPKTLKFLRKMNDFGSPSRPKIAPGWPQSILSLSWPSQTLPLAALGATKIHQKKRLKIHSFSTRLRPHLAPPKAPLWAPLGRPKSPKKSNNETDRKRVLAMMRKMTCAHRNVPLVNTPAISTELLWIVFFKHKQPCVTPSVNRSTNVGLPPLKM